MYMYIQFSIPTQVHEIQEIQDTSQICVCINLLKLFIYYYL